MSMRVLLCFPPAIQRPARVALPVVALLGLPAPLPCCGIDEHFAIDPPERLKDAISDPSTFGGTLAALGGPIMRQRTGSAGVDPRVAAVVEDDAAPVAVDVRYDRPGIELENGAEVQVSGSPTGRASARAWACPWTPR